MSCLFKQSFLQTFGHTICNLFIARDLVNMNMTQVQVFLEKMIRDGNMFGTQGHAQSGCKDECPIVVSKHFGTSSARGS